MTFEALTKAARTASEDVRAVLYDAEINADGGDLMASLETVLSFVEDHDIAEWFRQNGVRW